MNVILAEIRRHKWSRGAFLKDVFSSGDDGCKAQALTVTVVTISPFLTSLSHEEIGWVSRSSPLVLDAGSCGLVKEGSGSI